MNSQLRSLPIELLAATPAAGASPPQQRGLQGPPPAGAGAPEPAAAAFVNRLNEAVLQTDEPPPQTPESGQKITINQLFDGIFASSFVSTEAAASVPQSQPAVVPGTAASAPHSAGSGAAPPSGSRAPVAAAADPPVAALPPETVAVPVLPQAPAGIQLPARGNALPPAAAAPAGEHSAAMDQAGFATPAGAPIEVGSAAAARRDPRLDPPPAAKAPQPAPAKRAERATAAPESAPRIAAAPRGVLEKAVQIDALLRSAQPAPTPAGALREQRPAPSTVAHEPIRSHASPSVSHRDAPVQSIAVGSTEPNSSAGARMATVPDSAALARPANVEEPLPVRAFDYGREVEAVANTRPGPQAPLQAFALHGERERAALRPSFGEARRAESPVALAAAMPATEASARLQAPAAMSTPDANPLDAAGLRSSVAEQVAGRLISMTVNGQNVAKLHLQPAELGALEIRIAVNDDGALVSITAQQPHAREVIEAGIPRLREMFEGSGTALLDVDIGGKGDDGAADERAAHTHAPAQHDRAANGVGETEPGDAERAAAAAASAIPAGRLDLWA